MFELFEKAIKAGMTDFTLYRTDKGWQASSRWHSGPGWRASVARELETAIKGALAVQRYDKMPGDPDFSDLA